MVGQLELQAMTAMSCGHKKQLRVDFNQAPENIRLRGHFPKVVITSHYHEFFSQAPLIDYDCASLMLSPVCVMLEQ
jgi:hypothetical protein